MKRIMKGVRIVRIKRRIKRKEEVGIGKKETEEKNGGRGKERGERGEEKGANE